MDDFIVIWAFISFGVDRSRKESVSVCFLANFSLEIEEYVLFPVVVWIGALHTSGRVSGGIERVG